MSLAYTGKILRVDMTLQKTVEEPLNMKWARMFIGGKGLGAKYLFEELRGGTNPLSADNMIIFMTGPLTGTLASCTPKYVVITKSPLTKTFLDSYAGGYFGPELKFAGFDAVIITGRTQTPSYLSIRDGKAEIKNAEHLWGKTTHDTEKMIREEEGDRDIKVASIGPAGENLVKIACITNDLYRQAGRGGAGAVMGSKNLKAVAVKGTQDVLVPDINSFVELCEDLIKKDLTPENPVHAWAITDGTPCLIQVSQSVGILPTKNFQSGLFEHADEIDSEALKGKILVRRRACFSCPLACENFTKVRLGPFKDTTVGGPDYQTLVMAGSNCAIDDINAISKFNLLCDQLGLDTMSAGSVAALAMECYERRILSPSDTYGVELNFGNVDAYVKMPELIASRRGIGNILAEGAKRGAERIGKGAERFVLHVKGLEYPGYDPRGSIAMALAYATSDRGACHERAWPVGYEAFGDLDPFTTEGKAKRVIEEQNRRAVAWCFIFCNFYIVDYPTMAKLYSAATGLKMDERQIRLIGERVWNLTRAFSVREGLSGKDDTLPPRMMKPLLEGKAKGHIISKEDFEKMLRDYYTVRGWDQGGIPTRVKLEELGLTNVAAKMVVRR